MITDAKPHHSEFCEIIHRYSRTAASRAQNSLWYTECSARDILSPLRISVVQYLNTAPLVRGFTHGPLRGKYDLSFTLPASCSDDLRDGAADVAIIPAIEYQRIDNLVVLPDLAIAAKKRVRSLLIVARKPIKEVIKIALDRSSRSTQALTRILCAEHWRIAPEFLEDALDPATMLNHCDAALLIGDPALRLAIVIAAQSTRGADGELQCDAAAAGVGGADRLHVYDVVEEWRRMTGATAVLAIWAARRGVVTSEIAADFNASALFGMQHIGEICEQAAKAENLPAAELEIYLRENIDYTLDEQNQRGLRLYFTHAAKLGLIPRVKPLEWADTGVKIVRAIT